ncbi:SID1 transmembrane family member [Echinococcus granulosus]|uniref:SID1 transmembrane family member n=1 Tax=Echinococcus granulosus TaxID=6210 RepID=W6UMS7_ECHGR|nr:SID1 transmembrane family member [Echinococcus granulosus]EUB62431.1 SID1 transmembrane family member [Echinococcus granulosus]
MGRSHFLCVLVIFFILVWIFSAKCAVFSENYTGEVYLHHPQNYTYNLAGNKSSVAVRVNISAANVNETYPLLAIFKQQANVLSFSLPLMINNRFSYNAVSRTLCPSFIALDTPDNNTEQIIVELSSSMPDKSHAPIYRLQLDVLNNFVLQLGHTEQLLITPSEPQYFLFSLSKDIDSVIVHIHSTDKLCMTVSVQAAKCPVADILDTVKYSGVYQTVTTLGAITVSKVEQNITEFLVVLVLKPEDADCGGAATVIKPGHNSIPRVKNVTITVTPTLAGYHYHLPIYGAIGIYVIFYAATAIIILVYPSYDKQVQYYFNSFAGSGIHFNRRNLANASPPPQANYDSQIMSVTYAHSPVEGATTRARHVVGPSTSLASMSQVSISTLTPTASTSHQRPPPPPLLPPPSHSLFSSSSSSDLNDVDAGSTHLQSAVRRKCKKLRRPPYIALSPLQRTKQHHRRSMSYGSTRDMALREVPGRVERCSTCSRLSLGLEGGAGSTFDGGSVRASDSRGALNGSRGLPTVRQVGEGLLALPHLQINIDPLADAQKDRKIYLHSRTLFVSDLARKRYSTLDRKYLLYFWYLIIISIFYGLPVAQLVMTYQRALHDTGNEDICYYNFECAHPLGVFTAFNNIISNIGYVMLGLLFLGLTARRDLMHRRTKKFRVRCTRFCRWLCPHPRRSNGTSNTATANCIAGVPDERQGGASSPVPSVASFTAPMITVTRCSSRRLCSRLRLTCCHGSTSETSDSHPPNEDSIAALKDHQSNDEDDTGGEREMAYGIPQHYGLFYAMGLALTMEGLLSACYHICPSFSNFQFDTAYMYILALILMLKIYQTRHPDINASAHSAYMVMAVVILAGVTGVLYGGETFWVLFTIVFLTMSVWLTAEIYYMGQWNFDICLPRRLYNLMRSDGIHCLTPMYMERMLLLLVANCVNIGIAAFGLFTRPRDFSSFLLSIFMINLLMYYFFYVIMKCRFRERFHCIPVLYILLACITWGSAIYFFIQHSTTWEVTPAQSRALNQPCIFLGFYDVHDVWHFLSSTSMFFSFMSIMTLDDDLINTPRSEIPVF